MQHISLANIIIIIREYVFAKIRLPKEVSDGIH